MFLLLHCQVLRAGDSGPSLSLGLFSALTLTTPTLASTLASTLLHRLQSQSIQFREEGVIGVAGVLGATTAVHTGLGGRKGRSQEGFSLLTCHPSSSCPPAQEHFPECPPKEIYSSTQMRVGQKDGKVYCTLLSRTHHKTVSICIALAQKRSTKTRVVKCYLTLQQTSFRINPPRTRRGSAPSLDPIVSHHHIEGPRQLTLPDPGVHSTQFPALVL